MGVRALDASITGESADGPLASKVVIVARLVDNPGTQRCPQRLG